MRCALRSQRQTPYWPRGVGGGRLTRQPGQVRKEAAVTSTSRVAAPAPLPPLPQPALEARLMPTTADSPNFDSAPAPGAAAPVSGAGAHLSAAAAVRADRARGAGPHAQQRPAQRPRGARLPADRDPRRRQDHDRSDHRPRPQLRRRRRPRPADPRAMRRGRAVHHDRRGPSYRRAQDGCRDSHRDQ